MTAGLFVAPFAAVGIAAAAPIDGPLINTTCSYAQLESALRAEDPTLAQLLAERPGAQAKLRQFVGMSVDERKQRVQDVLARNPDWQAKFDAKRSTPEGQDKQARAFRIAATCQNY